MVDVGVVRLAGHIPKTTWSPDPRQLREITKMI